MRLLRSLFFFAAVILLSFAPSIKAQSQEVYTGTIVGVGGRLGGVSRPFTLTLNGHTADGAAEHAVATLAEGGQDRLLSEIRNNNLGRFSIGGEVGRQVNFVVEEKMSNGDRKLTILFERWLNLYEVRYGARSTDYPLSYVELIVDRNGHGQGTFIPAARVRFNKKNEVEIENLGIYPARLSGVRMRSS